MFKKIITTTALFFAISGIAYAKGGYSHKNVISVTGEATLYAKPDEVNVSMTIETRDVNIEVAQDKSDEIASKVLKLLKNNLRIAEKFIHTNYISVNPVYQYKNNCGTTRCTTPTFTHFETKKSIAVTLKDISKLQDLLGKSIEIGVTRINNVRFTSSEIDNIKELAQIVATKNARKKADNVASALGVGIGLPHKVDVDYSSPAINNRRGMLMSASSAVASEETIAPGQIPVKARVVIDFEIKG